MELLHTNEAGVTTKYTEEMLINLIKTNSILQNAEEHLISTTKGLNNVIATIRGDVYDFFNEGYTAGESEITCTVEDINELLEKIGCYLRLKGLYTVRATIDVTLTGIEAESEEDAESSVQDSLRAEWDGTDGEVSEYTIDVRRVEAE